MRANLVGRSVVSAITQTPASGCPLGARTSPPMSSASMAGVAAAACACAGWTGAVSSRAMPIAAALECRMWRSFISDLQQRSPAGFAEILARRYNLGARPRSREEADMEPIVSDLLNRYEKGSLSRRELVQGLAMLAAGGASTAQAAQAELDFKTATIDHVSVQVVNLQ